MLATVYVWADPRGGVHSTADEQGFGQFRERFKRMPDRVVVTYDRPTDQLGPPREVLGYLPPSAEQFVAARALPPCVAALQQAAAALGPIVGGHGVSAGCNHERMALDVVRIALALVGARDPLATNGGP